MEEDSGCVILVAIIALVLLFLVYMAVSANSANQAAESLVESDRGFEVANVVGTWYGKTTVYTFRVYDINTGQTRNIRCAKLFHPEALACEK